MTSSVRSLVLGLALVCAGSGVATAQTPFDMKGTWSGMSNSIVSGLPAHHPATVQAKPAGPNRLTSVKFTVKIDGQDGTRVWGTGMSPSKVDALIGVISPDGKYLRLVAQGSGIIEGTITGPDSIEIFYTEQGNGLSIAATNVLTRQK